MLELWVVIDNEGNIEGIFSSLENAKHYLQNTETTHRWPRNLEQYTLNEPLNPPSRGR